MADRGERCAGLAADRGGPCCGRSRLIAQAWSGATAAMAMPGQVERRARLAGGGSGHGQRGEKGGGGREDRDSWV
jgi:hypothetical protein